jgi:hypothetical protein
MRNKVVLSVLTILVLASTVMVVSPAYVSAKKSKGGGAGGGEFDSGYRAGVAKAAEDVGKFNANKINAVDGNNPPPCPLPCNKPYCDGWEKGYSDKAVDDLD